jgi:hypothetical protein
LPAHQHHQGEAEEQKDQPAKPVLDPDDFVVGGENIFSPPPELVMLMFGLMLMWMGVCFERSGSVHSGKSYRFNI